MFACDALDADGSCSSWVEVGPFFLPALDSEGGAAIAVGLLVIAAIGWGVRFLLIQLGMK